MKDACAREITYLRLSVTDLCDLRCRYCMPAEGVAKRPHGEICSVEEVVEIARQAVSLMVRKVLEALTAVSAAALTVCDMCKAVQKDMEIDTVRLCRKTGGKSGDYEKEW